MCNQQALAKKRFKCRGTSRMYKTKQSSQTKNCTRECKVDTDVELRVMPNFSEHQGQVSDIA